jgi:hypothetical protein
MGNIEKFARYLFAIGALKFNYEEGADNTKYFGDMDPIIPKAPKTPKSFTEKNFSPRGLSSGEYLQEIYKSLEKEWREEEERKQELIRNKTIPMSPLEDTVPANPNETIFELPQDQKEEFKQAVNDIPISSISPEDKEKARRILDLIHERNRTQKNYWEH